MNPFVIYDSVAGCKEGMEGGRRSHEKHENARKKRAHSVIINKAHAHARLRNTPDKTRKPCAAFGGCSGCRSRR